MISLQGSCVLRVETRSWFKATSALLEFDTLSPVPQGLLCRCYGFDWLWGHPQAWHWSQMALVSNGTGLKWHWSQMALVTDRQGAGHVSGVSGCVLGDFFEPWICICCSRQISQGSGGLVASG